MTKDSKLHLRIASPCKAPWENMDGDQRVRFCRECNRNVYNLSAMTEREARRVVAEREGRLCVRFYQRRDGTVLTSDCACNAVEDEPVRMGEPLMGTPPIDGDWDAGTGEPDEPEHPGEFIMGDIAIPPHEPLMGKIVPPTKDESHLR
jgi:hypothetical protein